MAVNRSCLYFWLYTWVHVGFSLQETNLETIGSWASIEGLTQETFVNHKATTLMEESEISLQSEYKDDLYRNRSRRANAVEIEETLTESVKITTILPSPKIPQFLQSQREAEKTIPLLRDQLDFSSIIDAVDEDTGRPKFGLQLIDLSYHTVDIKFDFVYDGDSQESSILGVGWSLPRNFIVMDHQASVFSEDEKYCIFLQDLPQQLIYDSNNSTEAVYSFKLPSDNANLQIRYFKNEERWEIDSSGVKQIYGHTLSGNLNTINWELTWENWRGVGSASTGQRRLATAWYLAEVRHANGDVTHYTYHTVNIPVLGGNNFTRETYLNTISDGRGNKVTFNYYDKDETEYDLFPSLDSDDHINTQVVQTRFLEGYKVTTANYEQVIHFVYTVEKGRRFLNKINQDGDITHQPVFQFMYDNLTSRHVLVGVILPNGAHVEFEYQSIGTVSTITEKIGQRFDLPKNYKIDYGSDDILLSYIDRQGQVALRMFNQDMTKELFSSVSRLVSSRLPLLGRTSVKNYESVRVEGFLSFVLHYSIDKELCLLHEEKGKWLSTAKCYNFNEDAIIRFGKNYIVVVDTNSFVEIISWNNNSKQWNKEIFPSELNTNKTTSLLTVFDRMFVVYDNDILWIGYMNRNNEWQSKAIKKIPGVVSDITETLQKCYLDSWTQKKMLNFFKNRALQLSKNLLLLNGWKAEGTQLYSVMKLFTLDTRYEIVQEQEYKVIQDDITEVSQEIERQNGNFVTFGYDKSFKIVVKHFRGPILNEIRDQISDTTEREKLINDACKTFPDLLEGFFVLGLTKYSPFLMSQTVTCGNKKFTFIGDRWNASTISEVKSDVSIPLGTKFMLYRDNLHSSLKLYSQNNKKEKYGNFILDLKVKQLNEILIHYPFYLAYQEANKAVGVVEFLNNGSITKLYKLPLEEKLSYSSSSQTLITSIDTSHTDINTLVFRQLFGIRRFLPNPVITKVTINLDDGNKRFTGYEYSSPKKVGSTVYYEKTVSIPGNDKESFGWFEMFRDLVNQRKVKIFNGQGMLIKTLHADQSETNDTKESENNLYSSNTILDKTGKLEVAQFFPYEIADEGIGFYGFEDYEVNRIGVLNSTFEKKWLFNENNVEKGKFSFTGYNFLRLSDQILEGTFQPNNQNEKYIASCWLRSQSQVLHLGVISPYLKAIIYTEGGDEIFELFGEVKLQSSDWFYLEVIIDFSHAKQIHEGLIGKQDSVKKTNISLKTSIIIESEVNTTIHVDHIRFSPLNCDFRANVYDTKMQKVREIIQTDGFVKKHIYDNYQERVATVNQYGQLDVLKTYTRASSVGKIQKLGSEIKIKPRNGFYEQFAPYSFNERWQVDDTTAFQISPGQLQHSSDKQHNLLLILFDISKVSYGIRLCFSLRSRRASIKLNNDLLLSNINGSASIVFLEKRRPIPLNGELIMVVEQSRVFIWIDGGLYFEDFSNSSPLNLEMSGTVRINDLIIFNEPNVQVTYFNMLGQKLQEIALESTNKAIVTEYLYDKLGRKSITTQPTYMERSGSQTLLAYYTNFITNWNPSSENSVWQTGRLKGEMSRVMGEYCFSQIKYLNNPLDEIYELRLPGSEFSVSAPYVRRFVSSTENLFVKNLFPANQNYSFRVEHKPGMVEDISVFDKNSNRVAWYVHVPGSKSLLSTYEYDGDGRLVKSLPPLYHEKIPILNKLNFSLSAEGKTLQDHSASYISYDEKGKIITKATPDSGKMENLYDDNGLLKFAVHYSNFNKEEVETIIYFDYDQFGRLNSTGELTRQHPKEKLLTLILSDNNTQEHQGFYYGDSESEPTLRRKLKRTITFNDEEPYIEESIINFDQQILSKRIIIPGEGNDPPLTVAINKRYATGKVTEIEYPLTVQGQPFKLTYQYNKLGKMTGVGIPGDHNRFANFAYNSAGQVISEHHLPESNKTFVRQYSYNSPGFLTRLEDIFLTENVFYTNGSYGGHGYGDGTVTRTEFKATWHAYSDNNKVGLNEKSFINNMITNEKSALCFQELKRAGYLNEFNRQAKAYYPALDPKLAIICSYGIIGSQIREKLGKQGFPVDYGHSYDYGNHGELTKAKYFVGSEALLPLQPDTFAKEISGINTTASREIWQLLKKARYLIEDNTKVDISVSHGKKGKSFIKPRLYYDLRSIDPNYGQYALPLEKLLTAYIARNVNLTKSDFYDYFLKWHGGISTDRLQVAKNNIFEMLVNKQYNYKPLAEDFNKSLRKYECFIPDIVRILSEHFAKELGATEFDVESYNIDANGNHKHFHTGFDRYELSYGNNTNQVNNVKFKSSASFKREQNFVLRHDGRGNVNQALHKGIKMITYNAVSNRTINIELTDGRTLSFYYDALGGRILKRVTDSHGQVIKEIHYIRDELGRALVERQIAYNSGDTAPEVNVTAYIYGPRGLMGFIRRDKFYSVITDHEGSIRLVVKDNQVLSAYDYLPYGNLMREYANNPDAHISYRYTGQEWDEEIGLYNYHARFYDPSIGRFYQIDPKEQYFSPYKYAGNSPISMTDPDGEFAFLLPIAFGIAGAYLGGSAANGNWNPLKWDYTKGSTWVGLISGGAVGAFLPASFGASMGAFAGLGLSSTTAFAATTGLGIGGAYLHVASVNNNWDPSKWDYSSPEIWNEVLLGFAEGTGLPGGIHGVGSFSGSLRSTIGKSAFISRITRTGREIFTKNGFAGNLFSSKPAYAYMHKYMYF